MSEQDWETLDRIKAIRALRAEHDEALEKLAALVGASIERVSLVSATM